MATCRHCAYPMPAEALTFTNKRGFCSERCRKAFKPPILVRECAQCGETFKTLVDRAVYCSRRCHSRASNVRRALSLPKDTPQALDWTPEQIEAKLAALAAHRRATRSWLRLSDETIWGTRPGSELHKQTQVETYALEGALL